LFTTPPRADGFASGSVTVTDPPLLAALRSDPGGFYTDLHTTKFPGGAVRAQLHLLNHPVATSGVAALQESVALGSQIYACTAQPDGSFALVAATADPTAAARQDGLDPRGVEAIRRQPSTRRPPRRARNKTTPTTTPPDKQGAR
jgi:hypothetical protein